MELINWKLIYQPWEMRSSWQQNLLWRRSTLKTIFCYDKELMLSTSATTVSLTSFLTVVNIHQSTVHLNNLLKEHSPEAFLSFWRSFPVSCWWEANCRVPKVTGFNMSTVVQQNITQQRRMNGSWEHQLPDNHKYVRKQMEKLINLEPDGNKIKGFKRGLMWWTSVHQSNRMSLFGLMG